MEHDEYLADEAPAATIGVNRTASDMTDDEWARLTPAQREALERADRGELPVDARSPLYDEPASANFVHAIDPRVAAGEVEATDTEAAAPETPAGAFDVLRGEVPTTFEGGNGPAEHLHVEGDEVAPDPDESA
jgi:hypothetical protein